MAAEMSTGILALMHTYQRNPPVSMLVTRMEASYFKKATGLTFFTCEQGLQIENVIRESCNSGEGKTISVKSIGKNKSGELIAEFLFTWSFKPKSVG